MTGRMDDDDDGGGAGEAETGDRVARDGSAPASWDVARRYAVVVDAGSSGSRMQVYSWVDPLVDRTQRERLGKSVKTLPKVEKGTWEGSGREWQLKLEPGLSSFGSHPHDVRAYLKKLFDHALSIVPPQAVAETPVYVLATAGMRLLPDEQRNAVLEATCDYIEHQTAFNFGAGGCKGHVQVISGEEEGLLGWIAINYLMDGFHFKEQSVGTDLEAKGQSTFGFLDMGGASTQIAFEPNGDPQRLHPDNQDDLTPISLRMLDGTDVLHNVFVTTFLGFGTNRARDRYMESLVAASGKTQSSQDAATVHDPCLPKDLRQSEKFNGRQTEVVGTGEFDQCLKSLTPLLDKDAACSRPPCLFHGVHVPPIDFSVNHFIGVSEYWFSSNDVFQLGGVYDFVTFQRAAQQFCGTSWDQILRQFSSATMFGKQLTPGRLEMQCFKSAWMATVLHEGIGLPRITDPGGEGEGRIHADEAQNKADAKNLFQSVNDVDGLAVSWTLGKAVLEASKNIPSLPAAKGSNSGSDQGTSAPRPNIDSSSDGLMGIGGSWQDKLSPIWPSSDKSSALRLTDSQALSGSAVLAFVFLVLAFLTMCLCLRGRSAKAIKRRAFFKDLFSKTPCGRRRPTQGDYTLANMEEGGGGPGRSAAGDDGGSPGASETSGEEDAYAFNGSSSRTRSYDKRRRPSGNSLAATLFVPLQRLGLALGFKGAALMRPTGPPPITMSNPNRRILSPRYPTRHHAVTLPISMSQPSSPKPFTPHSGNNGVLPSPSVAVAMSTSRPASRAGQSPRLMHESGHPYHQQTHYFGQRAPAAFAQQTSSTLNSNTVTATASARSSRAASPVFGLSSTNNPSGGHSYLSGAKANGRLTPSARAISAGFSRKAWEDSD